MSKVCWMTTPVTVTVKIIAEVPKPVGKPTRLCMEKKRPTRKTRQLRRVGRSRPGYDMRTGYAWVARLRVVPGGGLPVVGIETPTVPIFTFN